MQVSAARRLGHFAAAYGSLSLAISFDYHTGATDKHVAASPALTSIATRQFRDIATFSISCKTPLTASAINRLMLALSYIDYFLSPLNNHQLAFQMMI